jgi:hypothetical protein
MKLSDIKDIAMIAGIAYGIYWIYTFIQENKDKFNPASDQNLAYQGTNSLTRAITQQDETLGTWAYNFLQGHQEYDSYVMTPYTKADGTRGVRVTQVIRRSDGRVFRVVQGLLGPVLEPV